MSVIRTCCNKELVTSCIHGCDNRYCANTEAITFNPIDMSCPEYLNRDIFRKVLKCLEESENGSNQNL